MPTGSPPSRRDEYSAATRAALIAAARTQFAEVGFRAAALQAIASEARVTRGALYHHYADKAELFDAVVQELQRETAAVIEGRARAEPDVWTRLHVGMDAYLDECLKPAYRRLVIEEAPAVLGTERCREIERDGSLRLLTATLDALVRRGELAYDDTPLLARMVDAMICEVALLLPHVEDRAALRTKAHDIVEATLAAYRPARRPRGEAPRRPTKGARR